MVKVENMVSDNGNTIANQFIIRDGANNKVYSDEEYLNGLVKWGC